MDAHEFYARARLVAMAVDADEAEPLDVFGVLRSSLDELECEVEFRLPHP